MSRLTELARSRGTVAELFSGRNNGVGAIRLALAVAVVVSHTGPLGLGQHDVGLYFTGRQTNLGTMGVYGFFVLSGMLITRSARRVSIGRYAWHRALRIFPALWVCLMVTALVVAPLVAIHERGSLDGFWADPTAPGGPLAYLRANWWTGVRQYGIQDLLRDSTPWGRHTGGSVFDGALWSLAYEMLCYVGIGILAVTAVLNRARRFVLVLCGLAYLQILLDYRAAGTLIGPPHNQGGGWSLPLLGGISAHWMTYLGFLFAIGALVDLYREKIPINDALGIASLIVLVVTLRYGAFFALGMPAYAYALIWLSIRMPQRLHSIGRKNDYSYGIYIYGFVVQQVLASVGGNRWGFMPFMLVALAITTGVAALSWHLVEKHALRMKNWTPTWLFSIFRVRPPAAARPENVQRPPVADGNPPVDEREPVLVGSGAGPVPTAPSEAAATLAGPASVTATGSPPSPAAGSGPPAAAPAQRHTARQAWSVLADGPQPWPGSDGDRQSWSGPAAGAPPGNGAQSGSNGAQPGGTSAAPPR